MRFYIIILSLLMMLFYSVSFTQTYGYDKEYQKKLEESGVEINDAQKQKVRNDISKWANFYLDKHYQYNEKATLTHPTSKEKKTFRFDCSGYVAAVYWASNIAVFEKQAILDSGGVKTIYSTLSKYKKIYKGVLPNVGDIIMFDKTTSNDKKLTHAGIVIEVDEKDETVTYIHASTSKGLIIGYMNLKYPDLARKDGKIINSALKRGGGVSSLASHCFNSYGTILDIPEK
ncbi:biopolymer transport ExbB protein [Brachyspira suanatina]|uniref:Biopolymer transport ExbB protein n=1 Tax=Brachyspira suanatina TaxID=381802 RepID=A0A0G4K8Z6_9SPIR|nr:NlpC/P60 family protein [Brachyspira suanatina]CRF34571.1 biopolymer transport ExbB protein [Brachyspira suanatina]